MILVTGATGFIGSELIMSLVQRVGKKNVIAFTSRPTSICQYLLHNNYNFERNYFVENGFEQIDTIIHAGAFTPKSSKEGNDVRLSTSNIINTEKIVSSNFPHLKRFVFLSTLDVYEYDNPITESSRVGPVSLYGHSKLYCEEMITVWAEKLNISNYILRIGHVYGPGEEKYQKLIPIMMRQIIKKEPIKLYGTGDDIRTFIYLTDVIHSIIKSLGLQSKKEIINVVGNEQIKIKDLICKIIDLSKKEVRVEEVKSDNKPRHLIFDNSKLKELLYLPKVSLAEGLKREWEYFKKNENLL